MEYRYLKERGALNEAAREAARRGDVPRSLQNVPRTIIELMPAAVAYENTVLPIVLTGEMLTVAAPNAGDIGLADKLSFILNKKVRLLAFPPDQIRAAIELHYR